MLIVLCSRTETLSDSPFCSEKTPKLMVCHQLPVSAPIGMNFPVIGVRSLKMPRAVVIRSPVYVLTTPPFFWKLDQKDSWDSYINISLT